MMVYVCYEFFYDSQEIYCVFDNEKSAKRWVKRRNKSPDSWGRDYDKVKFHRSNPQR